MSTFERLFAAILLSLAAFWTSRGIGIPVWRDWEPGDAADIALCVFMGVILLTSQRERP